MASTNKQFTEQTLGVAQNVLPAFSLAETSLILTREPQETGTEQQVEPTSAEKTGFIGETSLGNLHLHSGPLIQDHLKLHSPFKGEWNLEAYMDNQSIYNLIS